MSHLSLTLWIVFAQTEHISLDFDLLIALKSSGMEIFFPPSQPEY